MLFNSWIFLYFFVIVYFLYLSLFKFRKAQNILLLVASYIFYGYWDSRFLLLIALSTVIDYFVGLKLFNTQNEKKRKLLVSLSVIANLSILGFFKYYNFFASSLSETLSAAGIEVDLVTLKIILPVGISFYTFQTMSYTLDIFRKKLEPSGSFIDFALFVSFFPQLVAGPIERAVNLLPQIEKPRKLNLPQVNAGIYLVLWGLFKKTVVADNAGVICDEIFNNHLEYAGFDLVVGVLAFTAQIYGDFSGYSDIARGISKMMGFELMVNFKLPYFALNPSDFWNRWHISLSSWLRDYLYIPLGGNRKGRFMTCRNLFLTMLLGGLWHGASWNFVAWGAFHGVILILYRVIDKSTDHLNPWAAERRSLVSIFKITLMFLLIIFGWLLFRVRSIPQLLYFLENIGFAYSAGTGKILCDLVFFSIPLIVVQFVQYVSQDLLVMLRIKLPYRVAFLSFLLLWIVIFGYRESTEFIYFQF